MDLHLPINYFCLRAESNFRFAIITTIYKCKSSIKSPLCHTLPLFILVRLSISASSQATICCSSRITQTQIELFAHAQIHSSHPQVGYLLSSRTQVAVEYIVQRIYEIYFQVILLSLFVWVVRASSAGARVP